MRELVAKVEADNDWIYLYNDGTYNCEKWDREHPDWFWKMEDDFLWFRSVTRSNKVEGRWMEWFKGDRVKNKAKIDEILTALVERDVLGDEQSKS